MWKSEVAGASKTTILTKDGVPIARFYAERFDDELLAKITDALNQKGV